MSKARNIDLSIVTVTMNSMGTIKALLHSLFEEATRDVRAEIIIVDNCSTDGTRDFIRTYFPSVTLIENTEIKGFAENNNRGIGASRGEFVALINPDVVVLPQSLKQLLGFMMSNKSVGIVAPKLCNADRSLQDSARRFVNLRTVFLRFFYWGTKENDSRELRNYLMVDADLSAVQPVDWVIGAVMIVRKAAFENIGLLDEKYFLYIEDQDLCYRMWKEGWSVFYYPEAVMLHNHQRKSVKGGLSRLAVIHAKSLLYFLWKHRILFSSSRPCSKPSPQ